MSSAVPEDNVQGSWDQHLGDFAACIHYSIREGGHSQQEDIQS